MDRVGCGAATPEKSMRVQRVKLRSSLRVVSYQRVRVGQGRLGRSPT
jgi:hypothetical protein